MPRIPRKDLKSKYFHVIVQGIEKRYIFEKYRYKEKYKKLLFENLKKYNVKLLSYCIMDNHSHMIIYSELIEELSRYMKSVNTSFGLYYNKVTNRVGYVFRGRFESLPIYNLLHLHRVLTYIHLNPVVAEICNRPEMYYFSSYNDFMNNSSFAREETWQLLKLNMQNRVEVFKFMHYMRVESLNEEKNNKQNNINERIEKYIKDNDIKDIIFQSDKVRKMINELKKENISFSKIAKFLGIKNKRLKEIISE